MAIEKPVRCYPAYKPSGVPWLGDVPQHWRVSPVKHCYEVQLGKMLQNTPKSVDDEEVPYLKAVNVQWFSVQNADSPTMWANPREIKQFGITKGDLLVCEGGEGGRCGLISSDIEGYIIQNALHRVRPIGLGTNPYLQYAMYAAAEYGWFDALNNKATIAHFTSEKLGAFLIPLPPLPEQRAIVRYLDHVDERIQRYVDAKEKLVGVLEEEKQAVVNRAVTRGLDPNVPLKPSGVDWLGDVPEHWEVRRLKSLLVDPLQYGANEPASYSDRDLPRYIRITDIRDNGNLREDSFRSLPEDIAEPYLLADGDILFARSGATVGKTFKYEPSWGRSAYAGYLIRARFDASQVVPDFIMYFTQSPGYWNWILQTSIQATIQNVSAERYSGLRIPTPSLSEQRFIVSYLDRTTTNIDAAIARGRRQIELLQEYRTRLISDVVTGKVDVREAASQLPEHTMTESG